MFACGYESITINVTSSLFYYFLLGLDLTCETATILYVGFVFLVDQGGTISLKFAYFVRFLFSKA